MEHHPSRRYFIFKSIILNNLFGVDIMPEAVEICKLRLFLKLVSQVEPSRQLEPLPDIDFNIRAGNTLVGYATERPTMHSDSLASDKEHRTKINPTLRRWPVSLPRSAHTRRRRMDKVTMAEKRELQNGLDHLQLELDSYLAKDMTPGPRRRRHSRRGAQKPQPFHWFSEFYAVMAEGGFDVIIGNPPTWCTRANTLGTTWAMCCYATISTKNLYCFTFERCMQLATADGAIGLIVPLTVLSSEKLPPLQALLLKRGHLTALPFPRRPESIFDGVEMPVAILVSTAAPTMLLRIPRQPLLHGGATDGYRHHSVGRAQLRPRRPSDWQGRCPYRRGDSTEARSPLRCGQVAMSNRRARVWCSIRKHVGTGLRPCPRFPGLSGTDRPWSRRMGDFQGGVRKPPGRSLHVC